MVKDSFHEIFCGLSLTVSFFVDSEDVAFCSFWSVNVLGRFALSTSKLSASDGPNACSLERFDVMLDRDGLAFCSLSVFADFGGLKPLVCLRATSRLLSEGMGIEPRDSVSDRGCGVVACG